jgi:transposase-like protein
VKGGEVLRRTWTPKQNKRSIVASILDGKYTIDVAARIMRVQPETIKRWLHTFGPEYLSIALTATND